jgi:hypothetical protein
MAERRKDLGENDVDFKDVLGDVGEKVADSISHKLHPLVERYAQMFAHGMGTPVHIPTSLGRRSIHGEKDGQAIFDALGAQEKELLWIENRISGSMPTTTSGSIRSGWWGGLTGTWGRRLRSGWWRSAHGVRVAEIRSSKLTPLPSM